MPLNIPQRSTEWAQKPFWKQQNQVILEKPEGGGDILNCQQNSAAQPLVLSLEKKCVCGRDLALGKLHSSFSCFIVCPPLLEQSFLCFHVTLNFQGLDGVLGFFYYYTQAFKRLKKHCGLVLLNFKFKLYYFPEMWFTAKHPKPHNNLFFLSFDNFNAILCWLKLIFWSTLIVMQSIQ